MKTRQFVTYQIKFNSPILDHSKLSGFSSQYEYYPSAIHGNVVTMRHRWSAVNASARRMKQRNKRLLKALVDAGLNVCFFSPYVIQLDKKI